MNDEEFRRLKALCGRIEEEQNENLLVPLVNELNQLLQMPGAQVDSFAAESKLNCESHRPGYSPGTLDGRYKQIVDSAVALMRSDYASLQMLFPERGVGGELLLLAFRGFNPQAAGFWEWVCADSKSTCGVALRTIQRVVAPDIAACDFMADSEDQQVYLQTGIRACQTTPLITGAGNVVGMISAHWRTPHQPSEDDFRHFDILAGQAAELIEHRRRVEQA